MNPSTLYETILAQTLGLTTYAYVHQPHRPRIANTEAKRQRRAKLRAITLRQLRQLKAAR